MVAPVRLRQVVIITRDLGAATHRLESELGLGGGFKDEGVGQFGLENRVLAVGDCFLEVLTPISEDSAGHRYLERQGTDAGYMAIFQFRDREVPRRRATESGARIVWQADLPDISGTHLDPRDVPGAIVSLDWADPPWSWHWAGPEWRAASTSSSPARPGGIRSLKVAVGDPVAVSAKWADVLGDDVRLEGTSIRLPEAGQHITFVATPDRGREGIVQCGLELYPCDGRAPEIETEIGGVLFTVVPPTTTTEEGT